ncbi:SDR family NAD(P)-dependent oxidoreductase, partial [Saccharopolyspora shandongensis]|uniref:SDR family NAD(P)-dependent oxidoreductase n=1 Tax=Saccharopolyspora shandongensis TaxID=418495 RepID=UPI0034294ACA
MGKLDGKVALVTGGARGMGAAHVRTFAAEGARIVFGDVLAGEGGRLAAEIGDDCRFFPHDVTEADDWSAIVDHTVSTFGGLDVLVNNAGILRFQSYADANVEDFRQILEVNLVSQWLGIKHAAPVMREGGSIVNISSVNGLVGGAGFAGYSAFQNGVRARVRCARRERGAPFSRETGVSPEGRAPVVGKSTLL